MIVRVPTSFARWGRSSLALALSGLLYASCTSSEDTEPFLPPVLGAQQPEGGGDLVSEDDACERLRSAALDAYDSLGCDEPDFEACPAFLRPAGGSGCYEYSADSVDACEEAYEAATSCRALSPCVATAVLNTELPTCELPLVPSMGGAGGAATGGAGPEPELGGAGGQAPAPQGGMPPVLGGNGNAGGEASGGAGG
jgi:hypothetical protein